MVETSFFVNYVSCTISIDFWYIFPWSNMKPKQSIDDPCARHSRKWTPQRAAAVLARSYPQEFDWMILDVSPQGYSIHQTGQVSIVNLTLLAVIVWPFKAARPTWKASLPPASRSNCHSLSFLGCVAICRSRAFFNGFLYPLVTMAGNPTLHRYWTLLEQSWNHLVTTAEWMCDDIHQIIGFWWSFLQKYIVNQYNMYNCKIYI